MGSEIQRSSSAQDDVPSHSDEYDGVPESLTSLLPLYERISAERAYLEELDRQLATNWRRGTMGELAVVELDDTRVSQARLHGETCAFGSEAGVVVVIDLNDGVVLDGFEGHEGDVTALYWDGDLLVSGGVDAVVRVFRPQGRGSSLFEEFEYEELVMDMDLDEADLLSSDLFGASFAEDDIGLLAALDPSSINPDSETAGANGGALARAPLYGGYGAEWRTSDWPLDALIVEPKDAVPDVEDQLLAAALGVPLNDADLQRTDHDEAADEGTEDLTLHGHAARVTGVRRVSKNQIVSSALDGHLILWDLEAPDKPTLLASQSSALTCLAVADGIAVVGSLDGKVTGYHLDSGDVAFELRNAHAAAVRSLHFEGFARGSILATGGADGLVKLWTMQPTDDGGLLPKRPTRATSRHRTTLSEHGAMPRRRKNLPGESDVEARREQRCTAHRFEGHAGAVTALQADDAKLVSASIDGSLRVWCLRTGAELYALDGRTGHTSSVDFQGPLLVSDGTGSSIVVHDFSPGAIKAPRDAHGFFDDEDDDDEQY